MTLEAFRWVILMALKPFAWVIFVALTWVIVMALDIYKNCAKIYQLIIFLYHKLFLSNF